MLTTTVTTAKAAASGGLGAALAFVFNDAEFIPLLLTGIFASVTSYFYDWVHRSVRSTGLKELSELMKYTFYGISVMFIVYYIGKEHGADYIKLPLTSWGFVAALCAGSAVTIVEWFSNIVNKIIQKRVDK